jgi:acetyl-CoA acyltransferase
VHQGISAELIAKKYNITRKEMEEFAIESHRKCAEAIKNGHFDSQIVKIPTVDKDGNKKIFSRDEGVRYPVDRQKMSSLKPVFKKDGVITAALASQGSLFSNFSLIICSF